MKNRIDVITYWIAMTFAGIGLLITIIGLFCGIWGIVLPFAIMLKLGYTALIIAVIFMIINLLVH